MGPLSLCLPIRTLHRRNRMVTARYGSVERGQAATRHSQTPRRSCEENSTIVL